MKLLWKRSWLYVSSIVSLLVLMGYAQSHNTKEVCSGVEVEILHGNPESNFITTEMIEHLLSNNENDVLIHHSLANIDVELLERRLYAHPYVKHANVYIDLNGKVKVQVNQRIPIARVIGEKESFYIDEEWCKLPLSPKYTSRVLLITGAIDEKIEERTTTPSVEPETLTEPLHITPKICSEKLTQLTPLIRYIMKDEFYKAQITEIQVLPNGECELYTLVGDAKIVFGHPITHLEEKMKNLKAFYKHALRSYGWEHYKTITVKYAKQIVCEKNVQPLKQ